MEAITYIINESEEFSGSVQTRLINGKDQFQGLTFEEYVAQPHLQDKQLKEVTPEEVAELVKKHRGSLISKEWEKITEEDYWHFLEVLPPMNYNGNYFQLAEAYQYDLRLTFIKTGSEEDTKYWKALLPTGKAGDNKEYIELI